MEPLKEVVYKVADWLCPEHRICMRIAASNKRSKEKNEKHEEHEEWSRDNLLSPEPWRSKASPDDSPVSVIVEPKRQACNANFMIHMCEAIQDIYEDFCQAGIFHQNLYDNESGRTWMSQDPCIDNWGIVFGAQTLFVEHFLKGKTHVTQKELTLDLRMGAAACLLFTIKFQRSDCLLTRVDGEPIVCYIATPLMMESEKLDKNKTSLLHMRTYWRCIKERIVNAEFDILVKCPRIFACLSKNALVHAEEFLHDLWLNQPTIEELSADDDSDPELPSFSSFATLRARGMVNYYLRAATRNHFDVLVDVTVASYALCLIGLACIVADCKTRGIAELKMVVRLMHRIERVCGKLASLERHEAPTEQHIESAMTIVSAAVGEEMVRPGRLATGSYGLSASALFVPAGYTTRVLSLIGQLEN